MSTTTFNFTDGVSGYVQKLTNFFGSTYSAATGWGSCGARFYYNMATGVTYNKHAIFQFDTSSIGPGATIQTVEFKPIDGAIQPAGATNPDAWLIKIGNWVGASLDASAADWGGGNTMRTIGTNLSSGTWYDLSDDGADPTPYVDASGTTDIALWIDETDSGTDWARNFNVSRDKCQLRVTYEAGGHLLTTLFVGR